MEYDYTPRGVCSRNIHVEVEDGIVKNVIFTLILLKRMTLYRHTDKHLRPSFSLFKLVK